MMPCDVGLLSVVMSQPGRTCGAVARPETRVGSAAAAGRAALPGSPIPSKLA